MGNDGPLVLVVDDERDVIMICRINLEIEGFRVEGASDGEEAIECARKVKPDLMVIDATMPVMDGWQTLEALKQDQELGSIPVIMLTARVEEESATRAIEAGAAAYVTKPFEIGELVDTIRECLCIR